MNQQAFVLDLDLELMFHLTSPASWQVLRDEHFSPELLEDDFVKRVYVFTRNHFSEHGVLPTTVVLEEEFKDNGVVFDTPQVVIGDLIHRLRKRYANNQGRQAILAITQKTIGDPTALSKSLLDEGRRLYNLLTPRGKSFCVNDYEKSIAQYHRAVVAGRGPSMGFTELDNYFYGQRGLTFMVGAPKSFKSWFTVKAVLENIKAGGHPYLYSLELPADETDMRLRCLAADVPYWKFLQHQLDKQDLQAIEEHSEILASFGEVTIDKPQQGDRTVDSLIGRARDAGADVIFVDQLQYVENRRGVAVGATNDTKDYFEVINDIRDFSDDGPVWVVHQFNRSVLNADAMPEMQQIKGSAAVEECSTLALGLWSNKEMRKSNLLHIGTLTARNYGFQTWEAQVRMRTGCAINIIDEVDE